MYTCKSTQLCSVNCVFHWELLNVSLFFIKKKSTIIVIISQSILRLWVQIPLVRVHSTINWLGLSVFLSKVCGFLRALRLPPTIKTGERERERGYTCYKTRFNHLFYIQKCLYLVRIVVIHLSDVLKLLILTFDYGFPIWIFLDVRWFCYFYFWPRYRAASIKQSHCKEKVIFLDSCLMIFVMFLRLLL